MAKEGLLRYEHLRDDLQNLVSQIHDHFDYDQKTINWKLSDRRSLSANAQVHVWAKQISDETGEDVKSVYARMKRDQGLPIILADKEYGPVIDWMLKKFDFHSKTESQQLIIIDAIEVTRNFSTGQHNCFRDNVQAFYNENGFNLQYLENESGK
jgi:hypothetical protein